MSTTADTYYRNILSQIRSTGIWQETRNAIVKSKIDIAQVIFYDTPLVTLRKTAWKKAIQEMEWILSNSPKCPDHLLDWWDGQLGIDGKYFCGYGSQLRDYTTMNGNGFDQIAFIQKELKRHPNSRRLLTTTWHPEEMASITKINDNPKTPTTCHGTITQYFVRNGALHMKTYQRSADMLLGVPHNWIQYWALLIWFAHHANLKVGSMIWIFGDAHVYREESHIEVANEIINCEIDTIDSIDLIYTPTSKEFKADDFAIVGHIPEPITKIRPKLM